MTTDPLVSEGPSPLSPTTSLTRLSPLDIGPNPIPSQWERGETSRSNENRENLISASTSSVHDESPVPPRPIAPDPPPVLIIPPPVPIVPPPAIPQPLPTLVNEPQQDQNLRRSTRPRTQSVILRGFVTNTALSKPVPTSTQATSSYPISEFISCDRFTQSHQAFLAAITEGYEPKSFQDAMAYKVWRDTMGTEIGELEENHTWDLEVLPEGKKAIGSKWVFTIKYRYDGTIERYKARLVALGNRQIEGVDYGDTFAPVAKIGIIRLFLRVAAGKNWPVHQMDVNNAFLHGDLEEEVYMKLPQGFQNSDASKVCQLRKSIYGLK